MGNVGNSDTSGIGLAEAIGLLRSELLAARAAGAGAGIQLPVASMTVELHVAATRSGEGKAGFTVPFVHAELGGSAAWQRESVQIVTVVFGSPVDDAGNPVPVAAESARLKG